jgi:putative transferase (TIGR04331 family)
VFNIVTTKDPNLWSHEQLNILCGPWILDDSSHKSDNFILSDYHWNNKDKVAKDIEYIKKIYDTILLDLSNSLNDYHKKDYPIRYWEILLSTWLIRFIVALFDRWEIITEIKNKYKGLNSNFIKYNDLDFIPYDTEDFSKNKLYSDDWNHWIFYNIILFIGDIQTKEISKINFSEKINKIYRPAFKNLYFSNFLHSINSFFFKEDFFCKNLYLSRILKIKLYLNFFQLPVSYNSPHIEITKPIINERLKLNLHYKDDEHFLKFFYEFIKLNIPTIFIEGYQRLENIYSKLNWPKNPKVIMTSVSHATDEIFKIYTAKNILKKSKFYIFQHGGSFGSAKFMLGEYIDIKISDKFFSWGWSNNSSKVIPSFISTVYKKKIKKDIFPKGVLISLTELHQYPGRIDSGPRIYLDPFKKNILNFIKALDADIIGNSCIKYKTLLGYDHIKNFFLKNSPQISIMEDSKPIYKVSKKFKITVETLNSTGLLESLALNIPVIFIHPPSELTLRNESLHYYEMLKDVKIIHDNPYNAARFINNIYDDIDKWWLSKDLQMIRKSFCKEYAQLNKNSFKEFIKEIKI